MKKVLFKLILIELIVFFCVRDNSIAGEKRGNNEKKITYQLIVSAKGGANYFIRIGNNKWTGWGESYGFEGEFRIVFLKSNIGIGIGGGMLFETAVAEVPPNADIVWTRKVTRIPILLKIFLYPGEKINSWVGNR